MGLDGLDDGSPFDMDAAIDDALPGGAEDGGGAAAEAGEGGDAGGVQASKFEAFLKEKGLDEDAALRLLQDRAEAADEESAQERELELDARAQRLLDERFPQLFPQALNSYLQDPKFRGAIARKLATYDPRFAAAGAAQGGDDGSIDPTTQLVRRQHAEMVAMKEQLQALEQRLEAGAERDMSERSYHQTVAGELDRFMERFPEAAEFGDELIRDLGDKGRNPVTRFRTPQLETKKFLRERLAVYKGLKQRLETSRGTRTTRPGGGPYGNPPTKARANKTTDDLSVRGITAAVMADVLDGRAGGSN